LVTSALSEFFWRVRMGGCERTGKLKAKAQETMAHGNKPQRGDRDIDSSELYRHWTNQTLPNFWLSLMAVAKGQKRASLAPLSADVQLSSDHSVKAIIDLREASAVFLRSALRSVDSQFLMADIEAASVTVVSGTESFPATAGLRPLTTRYTYAPTCITRWYQPYPDSSSYFSSLYSTYRQSNHFASCQPSDGPSTNQLRYSPGVCPDGQTIATITESRTVPVAEDGSGRVWLAYCCLRSVSKL
jgi:hypothetical protein